MGKKRGKSNIELVLQGWIKEKRETEKKHNSDRREKEKKEKDKWVGMK